MVIDDPTTIEEVLVTGRHIPQGANGLSDTSVLTASALARQQPADFVEALRSEPGITIERQGGPGGVTSLYVRGGEANFATILINGIEVNDPTNTRGGAFDFNNIDLFAIDRTEIVRGSQSAVYGSGGLSGVINVLTRRSGGKPTELYGGIGSNGHRQVGLRGSRLLESGTSVGVGIRRLDSGEGVDGYTFEGNFVNASLDTQMADANIEVFGYLADSHRTAYPEDSGGPDLAASDDLDRGRASESVLGLAVSKSLGDRWDVDARGGWYRHRDEFDSPGIAPYLQVPPNGADTEFDRLSATVTTKYSISEGVAVAAGADARRESGDSDGFLEFFGMRLPTNFDLSRTLVGSFVEARYETERASIGGSVRVDGNDDFDRELTHMLSGAYRLPDGTLLRGKWGEGFKLPSFFALGHPLVGNPNLVPEESVGWDLGAEREFGGDKGSVGITYFRNQFENLVDFDSDLFINVNRTEVSTSGVETSLEIQASESLLASAHATYTQIDVKDAPNRLRGRPEWRAGASLTWMLNDSVTAFIRYLWVDHALQSSLVTGPMLLDDYHRVDTNVNWRVNPRVLVTASLDNLLDSDYEEAVGTPAPGRALRFSATYSIGSDQPMSQPH